MLYKFLISFSFFFLILSILLLINGIIGGYDWIVFAVAIISMISAGLLIKSSFQLQKRAEK